MKKIFLLILSFFAIFFVTGFFLSKTYALDTSFSSTWYLEYYFYSNNNENLTWQVGFRLIGNHDKNESQWVYSSTWKDLTNISCPRAGSGNRCAWAQYGGDNGTQPIRIKNPAKYKEEVVVQYGTGCMDPAVRTEFGTCYGTPQYGYCTLRAADANVTYNDAGVDRFESNGGGTIWFGGFYNTNNCPKVPTCNKPTKPSGWECGTKTNSCGTSTWSCNTAKDYTCSNHKCICPEPAKPANWECGTKKNKCGNRKTWYCPAGFGCVNHQCVANRYYIGGNVWVDEDYNGPPYNPNKDSDLNGVRVHTVNNSKSNVTGSGENSDGEYFLDDFLSGTYNITLDNPNNNNYVVETSLPRSVSVPPDRDNADFRLTRIFSISGGVINNDTVPYGKINGSEAYRTGQTVTIQQLSGIGCGASCYSDTTTSGSSGYSFGNLKPGSYKISYTSLPGGYEIKYPQNATTPPSFTVSVGLGLAGTIRCNTGGFAGVSCNDGDIRDLNFGIAPIAVDPWYQTVGGDFRIDDGILDKIPATGTCSSTTQAYASATTLLPGLNSPGIIFTAQGSAQLGGTAGNQAAKANSKAWYSVNNKFHKTKGIVRTSYDYLYSTISKGGVTIYSLFPGGNNSNPPCGSTKPNCTFPAAGSASFPSRVYKSTNGLTIQGSGTYNFNNGGNYIFLIDGDIRIERDINVAVGTSVIFVASGNIEVAGNVTRIEGVYSADNNFIVEASANRLTVEGTVIADAAQDEEGGQFQNNRDLGTGASGNTFCPSIQFTFRSDFVLNLPDTVRVPNYIIQEVAPGPRFSNTTNPGETATPTPLPTATPTPILNYVTDTYTRTLANTWGNADTGGAYTPSAGTNDFDVGGTTGTITINTAGITRQTTLDSVSQLNTVSTIKLKTDKLAQGASIRVSLLSRKQANGDYYGGKIIFEQGGVVKADLTKFVGSETAISGALATVPGLTHSVNTFYNLKFEVTGTNPTTLRMKIWQDGQSEPSTWTTSVTDSSSTLQAAGSPGIRAYYPSTATNPPLLLTFDNYNVNNPSAPVFTSTPTPTPTPAAGSPDAGLLVDESAFQFPSPVTGTTRDVVKTYGATCNDSSNNDRDAIINAIAAASAGDEVYIPPNCTLHLKNDSKGGSTIDLKTGVSLRGADKTTSVIAGMFTSAPNPLFYARTQLTSSPTPAVSNLTISNFTYTTTTGTVAPEIVIKLGNMTWDTDNSEWKSVSRIKIDNLIIEKYHKYGVDAQNTKFVYVSNNTFRNATALGGGGEGYGIKMDGDLSQNNWVKGNSAGPLIRHAYLLQFRANHNLIDGNNANNTSNDAVDFHGELEYSNEIRNNNITNCTTVDPYTAAQTYGSGVGIGETPTASSLPPGDPGHHDFSGDNNWVHDNNISGCYTGIRANNVDYAYIDNNTVGASNRGSGGGIYVGDLDSYGLPEIPGRSFGTNNVKVRNNTVTSSPTGFRTKWATGLIVTGNSIINNSPTTLIVATETTSYNISNNTFTPGGTVNLTASPPDGITRIYANNN